MQGLHVAMEILAFSEIYVAAGRSAVVRVSYVFAFLIPNCKSVNHCKYFIHDICGVNVTRTMHCVLQMENLVHSEPTVSQEV